MVMNARSDETEFITELSLELRCHGSLVQGGNFCWLAASKSKELFN
jgi:hypothetical protein